jgi:hypothetical protein
MRTEKAIRIVSWGAIILGLIVLSMAFFSAPATRAQTGPVVINEIRTEQSGADVDEYFELTGPADYSLDNLTYLVIGDAPTGTIECTVDLSGYSIPSDGFFVVAEDTFTLGGADVLLTSNALNFEGGDNVTHLLVYGFTGAIGDDVDVNDDCTQDIYPWSMEYDRIALILEDNPPSSTECHYGPPYAGPDGSFVPGQVYRCGPAMAPFYGWFIGLFDPVGTTDTPGAANYNCNPTAIEVASVGASSAPLPVMALGLALVLGGGGLAVWRRRR